MCANLRWKRGEGNGLGYRIILELSTPWILAANQFFLFQPKARNMLNTRVYHLLAPTCFGVCYTIFRQTIALFATVNNTNAVIVLLIVTQGALKICTPLRTQTQLYTVNTHIANTQNKYQEPTDINLLNPTGHVMHQQFNIQQLYVLPTLYLCVLYLSENKQRLVPLTA